MTVDPRVINEPKMWVRQGVIEPSRAGFERVGPGPAGLGRAGPDWDGLGRVGPGWAGLGRVGPGRADSHVNCSTTLNADLADASHLFGSRLHE